MKQAHSFCCLQAKVTICEKPNILSKHLIVGNILVTALLHRPVILEPLIHLGHGILWEQSFDVHTFFTCRLVTAQLLFVNCNCLAFWIQIISISAQLLIQMLLLYIYGGDQIGGFRKLCQSSNRKQALEMLESNTHFHTTISCIDVSYIDVKLRLNRGEVGKRFSFSWPV